MWRNLLVSVAASLPFTFGQSDSLNFSSGEIEFTPLTPREALAYFARKTVGARFSYDWRDVWAEEHAAAFVVAKVMREEILKDIYSALEQALKDGTTQSEFIRSLRPLLQEKGWWGFQDTIDPLTGETRRSELGTPRRLRTIYRVNLEAARAAGRWEQIERVKDDRPWLMYVDAGDNRVRHSHRQLNKIIRRVDDPFWKTFYPPNGWNCRCIVRQLSDRKLEELGLKETTDLELSLLPATKLKSYRNLRTGRITRHPAAVHPAFSYNVGQARLRGLTRPRREVNLSNSQGPRAPQYVPGLLRNADGGLDLPDARSFPAGALLADDISDAAAIQAFLAEFDGPMFFDKAQLPVLVNEDLFRDVRGRLKVDKRDRKRYLPLLAATLREPDEIWHRVVTQNGETRLWRIYWSRWLVEGEDVPATVIYANDGDGWFGVTSFQLEQDQTAARRLRYLNTAIRDGVLVYQRPKTDG